MFNFKKKDKKEITSVGGNHLIKETTSTVKKITTGGGSEATSFTRTTSLQASSHHFTSTTSSTHEFNSEGNISRLLGSPPIETRSLLHDANPWAPRNPRPSLPSAFLSPTSTSTGTTSASGLRNITPYRSTFTGNTYGSYPSRTAQSPAAAAFVSSVPTYPLTCRKRGKALIINNIKFKGQSFTEERLGAEKDSRDMKRMLEDKGFEVNVFLDQKAKQMIDRVETFSKSTFKDHDICMLVIMSHGSNIIIKNDKKKVIRGGYTNILGVDDNAVSTDDIIEKFSEANPSLKGKPKILIFQCCRGEKDQVSHDAAPNLQIVKPHSDILIAYSTLPGHVSNRNPIEGTWYIQSICEVFNGNYKKHHVEDMLKIVDDQLGRKHPTYKQTSTYENRGFKRCFLYPQSLG